MHVDTRAAALDITIRPMGRAYGNAYRHARGRI